MSALGSDMTHHTNTGKSEPEKQRTGRNESIPDGRNVIFLNTLIYYMNYGKTYIIYSTLNCVEKRVHI